ncbi:MAG: hypothetical protein NZ534_12620, partial [Bacteroidia bacterium]|nr:hypothetical protein [Bacteroidia bacterium]
MAKRMLTILTALALSATAFDGAAAQAADDDAYATPAQRKADRRPAKLERKEKIQVPENERSFDDYDEGKYAKNLSDDDTPRFSESDGRYYDPDDYYYTTRLRRFHQPWYVGGYFSPFAVNPVIYAPGWAGAVFYDPFWDPWGPAAWYATYRFGWSFSITFGTFSPYFWYSPWAFDPWWGWGWYRPWLWGPTWTWGPAWGWGVGGAYWA